jgi:UDPglucose 6-dehydrogenase
MMNYFDRPKIGIVGLGFVGSAIRDAMDIHCDLILVDKDPTRSSHTFEDLKTCEGVFVSVPTPFGEDGQCDTSALEYVLEQLKGYDGVIISKCTAPPLTYKALNDAHPNLVHAPEFLTAANASLDYVNGKFIIIGGRVQAYREQAERIIKMGQSSAERIAHCTIEEASLVKYTINSFLATKVTFMNEIYQLANAIGADYKMVSWMATLDNRIGDSHMKVPGLDGQLGFGGMCFPKDTSALLKYAEDSGVTLNVLDAAVKKNTLLRLTEPK